MKILQVKNEKPMFSGREYVLKNASKEVCATQYVREMKKLTNQEN